MRNSNLGRGITTSIPIDAQPVRQHTGENIFPIGVHILNITFDGLAANRPMCESLGASIDVNNMQPFIEIDGERILIILDPPHMIKLLRNVLGKHGQLHINGRLIAWRYIDRLESRRVKNNFVSHKLTKEHVQWEKNKMQVSLATQTFSRSVASAIDYLRNEGDILFSNSEETCKFIRTVNDLFDIFNSKHDDSTSQFRRGLSINSATKIFNCLGSTSNYIKSLKIGWRKIVASLNVFCINYFQSFDVH